MKAFHAFCILLILLITNTSLFGQQGTWTWMNGDSSDFPAANYGTLGIPGINNTPPEIYESNGWVDLQGNLWLYGGNWNTDLWKYDVSTNMWTWVRGSGIFDPVIVYGVQGIPSIYNTPGPRQYGYLTWVDLQGICGFLVAFVDSMWIILMTYGDLTCRPWNGPG